MKIIIGTIALVLSISSLIGMFTEKDSKHEDLVCALYLIVAAICFK